MKIKRFKAKGVNGYLDFDVKFNSNLTFLIGINGSGKTTALRLILGLCTPSWINLTQIAYDFAEVVCQIKDGTITIRSENHNNEKIKLIIKSKLERFNSSNFVRYRDFPKENFNDVSRFELRQMVNHYSRYENVFQGLEAVKLIKELKTPIFLGLDRRIYNGEDIDNITIENFSRRKDLNIVAKGNLYESLNDIEELIRDNFIEFSQKQTEISSELKDNIIYSSFETIKGDNIEFPINEDINIESRKKKILNASQNIQIPNLGKKIEDYFSELSQMLNKLKMEQDKQKKNNDARDSFIKALELWFKNSPQLERIDKIISLYEKAQSRIEEIYFKFKEFEEITNQYFSENKKKLLIEKNGEIKIHLPNGVSSDIYHLSSGEKQILVMLTQLIFGERKEIFIIDEPELSLHLEWQEIFVKTLQRASPNAQFILATHAPSIIGAIENQKYCQDLTQKQ